MEIKSRIEILDELSVRFGSKTKCHSFNDFLDLYNNEAVIRLVMIAMNKIELQGMQIERNKNINNLNTTTT